MAKPQASQLSWRLAVGGGRPSALRNAVPCPCRLGVRDLKSVSGPILFLVPQPSGPTRCLAGAVAAQPALRTRADIAGSYPSPTLYGSLLEAPGQYRD